MSFERKIIRSKYIFTNEDADPINGYLIIHSDKFFDIIPEKSCDFANSFKDYEIYNYENFYIFPGIIDLNVHLNYLYDEEWEDTENITKMASKGGITTIVNNPIFSTNILGNIDNSLKLIKLLDSLYVDCGFYSFLDPNHFQNSCDPPENGCLGYKGYLSPCQDPSLSYFKKKDLNDFKKCLQAQPNKSIANLYVFHSEMANERDMFICSPCRSLEKEHRVDLNYKIGETSDFGGGFSGDTNAERDSGDEEEKDGVLELEALKLNSNEDSPTTASLKINARIISLKEQEKFIAVMEASQYQEQTKELQINDEIMIETDSELEISEKTSENSIDDQIQKKKSCPSFPNKNKSVDFSSSNFHFGLKSKIFTTVEIPLNENSKNYDIDSNDNESLKEINPRRCNSKSPTKKFESCLIARRKKNLSLTHIDSPLSIIRTTFEKKQEEEKNNNVYFTILSSHPIIWENDGINFILKTFHNNFTSKVLVSNVSNAKLAFDIRDQRKNNPNLNIYCDISIPYLFFCSEMIKKSNTKYKNSPPIREKQDRMNSLQSLKLGVFDCVSSYHFQVPTLYKDVDNGNFRRAFSGNSCIGYNLQAVWTKLFSLEKQKLGKKMSKDDKSLIKIFKTLIRVLCVNPARILQIQDRKGQIKPENDADFVVWDPFTVEKIRNEDILLKYPKMFLFRKLKLYGKVVSTFLRGERVYTNENGKHEFEKKGCIFKREIK